MEVSGQLHAWLLYPQYPLNGPQSQSGCSGKEKNSQPSDLFSNQRTGNTEIMTEDGVMISPFCRLPFYFLKGNMAPIALASDRSLTSLYHLFCRGTFLVMSVHLT